jgi:hypothetical protein
MLVYRTEGYEDETTTFMARILAGDGNAAEIADVSTCTYKVYSQADGTETGTGSVTVATSFFDTLQTDARWTFDTTGYNFRFDVGPTAFPDGGRAYRVEFKVTFSDAAVRWIAFEHFAEAVQTS